MTKQKYKMILKLVDKNAEVRRGCNGGLRFVMDKECIEQLKQDIKDLFEEHCGETNGAEYAERIIKAINILQSADAFVSARKAIPLAIQVLLGAGTKNYDKEIETL